MDGRFLGIGLTNAVGIFFFVTFMSLLTKTILTMYPISGLTEAARAS